MVNAYIAPRTSRHVTAGLAGGLAYAFGTWGGGTGNSTFGGVTGVLRSSAAGFAMAVSSAATAATLFTGLMMVMLADNDDDDDETVGTVANVPLEALPQGERPESEIIVDV